jgi:hypothetical protein
VKSTAKWDTRGMGRRKGSAEERRRRRRRVGRVRREGRAGRQERVKVVGGGVMDGTGRRRHPYTGSWMKKRRVATW